MGLGSTVKPKKEPYIRVPSADADAARQHLRKVSLLPRTHLPRVDGDHVLLPITERTVELQEGWEIVDAELKERPNDTKTKRDVKQTLAGQLTTDELQSLKSAVDVIGDIGVVEIDWELRDKGPLIGQTILQSRRQLATVLGKLGAHEGNLRLQKFIHLAGENRTQTIATENGVRLKLDLASVYYSPRSAPERKRLCALVREGERVLVMFCGCGPYVCCVGALTKAREVVGVELNEIAADFCRHNIELNKLGGRASLEQGDVRMIVPELGIFDRVVMPMPHTDDYFLDCGVPVVGNRGWLHMYFFDGEKEAHDFASSLPRRIEEAVGGRKSRVVGVHRCGNLGPGKFRWCFDVQLDV